MFSIEVSGAKNISLALLPTILTTNKSLRFINLPEINDVIIQRNINQEIGINIYEDKNSITYTRPKYVSSIVSEILGCKIRSSLYYLGALLSCTGKSAVPHPGGCNFKDRSFDMHVGALSHMGACVNVNSNTIYAEKSEASAKHIRLPAPSKGVTINLIFLASRLDGKTIIENASIMPEIKSLVSLYQKIGFDISIHGSNIIIYGNSDRESKEIIECVIPYDRIEAGTFAVLSLLLKEETHINGIDMASTGDLIHFLDSIHASYVIENQSIIVHKKQMLRPTIVNLGFPPAIDSDFGPILVPLLCLIKGRSIIVDGHNTHRINNLLAQLSSLNAQFHVLAENVFEINGVSSLYGSGELFGSDIRGTMGLALAALVCKGNIKVHGLNHIDRAYVDFRQKISKWGLSIDID